MRKISLLFVSIVLLSQFAVAAGYPLNGTWELMDSDSWSFQFRQKNAPEGFVCGYVVDDAWGNNYFSMYVVKKGNKYELIYNKPGVPGRCAGFNGLSESKCQLSSRMQRSKHKRNRPYCVRITLKWRSALRIPSSSTEVVM